jgi:hypothetical protein
VRAPAQRRVPAQARQIRQCGVARNRWRGGTCLAIPCGVETSAGAWKWVPVLLMALAGVGLVCPRAVCAQTQTMNLAAGLGGGFERGTGYGLLEGRRSPIFVEAAVRTYLDEEPAFVMGGSLRFELERAIGLAIVPRAELRSPGSFVELRPGIGLPIFVSPRIMIGPEISMSARLGPRRGIGVFMMGTLAGFFVGGDVPDDSTVVMMNVQIGMDLQL